MIPTGAAAKIVLLSRRADLATFPAAAIGTIARVDGEVFIAVGTTRVEVLRRLGWEHYPNVWLRSDTLAYIADEHPAFGMGFDGIARAVNRVLRSCSLVAANTAGRPGVLFVIPASAFYTNRQRRGFVDLVIQETDPRTGERYLRATHLADRRSAYRGRVLWQQ